MPARASCDRDLTIKVAQPAAQIIHGGCFSSQSSSRCVARPSAMRFLLAPIVTARGLTLLAEWIADDHAVIIPAVAQVFGKHRRASLCPRSLDDGAIPI